MDADQALLWSAAATTLVALMATDSWERVKAGFAASGRALPGQVSVVEGYLEAAPAAAVPARRVRDEEAVAELAVEWRSRLRRLAGSDQVLQAEVRRLVEEFRSLPPGGPMGPVVMIALAPGGGRVDQADRDQTVTSL